MGKNCAQKFRVKKTLKLKTKSRHTRLVIITNPKL